MVYKDENGNIIIIGEAKGGGAERGSRRTTDNIRAEQGTPDYRDDILERMQREADETNDPKLQETVDKIRQALEDGKLQYLQLSQRVDS
jgi:hypothetical protein